MRFIAITLLGLATFFVQASTLQTAESEGNDTSNFQAKVESPKRTQSSTSENTIANDFSLPVTLRAKDQFLDGKTRTSIFIDDVVIRQGSLEILADRVEANATAGKGKEIITATGSPATYTQRLEDGSSVSASANEIVYTVESQTISLRGNAAITQNEVSMSGNNIAFDMAKERIMASTDKGSSDIVTTVLSPGAFKAEEQEGIKNDNPQNPENEQDKPDSSLEL